MGAQEIIQILTLEGINEITVRSCLILLIAFEFFVIRALWKRLQELEDHADAMADKFAGLAERYDGLARQVSEHFNNLVGRMAEKMFGRGDGGG